LTRHLFNHRISENNMKKLIIAFVGIVVMTEVNAQFVETTPPLTYNRYFSVSYDVNAPLSNTDFAGKVSGRGVQLGYREKINDHFYAGLQLSSATYNDYAPRQTYYSETSAFTTDLYKYVYSYGVTVNGDYYFSPDKRLSPFVGLGIGANYNSYKMFYNIYSSTDSGWGVLVRPEIGALLKLGSRQSWGIVGAVHFDYASTKSDKFDYPNFTNIGLRLGVVFMSW
jgi:hypothetical protein